MTTFAGIPVEGDTPSERRAQLLELSKQNLIDRMTDLSLASRESFGQIQQELVDASCLPPGELAASPFALRASMLGLNTGTTAVHHELRVPLTGQSLPAGSSVANPHHGQWDRGVRLIGKYQSFRHDAPFFTYNPNHMAKWTPHEMLHRSLGFVLYPQMTRWEYYLASRLNELVPVIHWYGTDEVLRLTNDGFDRAYEANHPQAKLEDAQWLTMTKTAMKRRLRDCVELIPQTVRRFHEEIKAVKQELDTGYLVSVEHPTLDSSSDALAYVAAHYDRVMHPPTQMVLRRLAPEDARFESVHEYLDATEQLFDQLLFGELQWNAEQAHKKRKRRACWDLLLRASLHQNVDNEYLTRGIQQAPDGFWDKLSNVKVMISGALDGDEKEEVMAAGFAWKLRESLHSAGPKAPLALRSAEEIVAGLESIVPVTLQMVSSEQIADFVSRQEVHTRWKRQRLWRRFYEFLCKEEGPVAELCFFEASLYQSRPANNQIEQLAEWPDDNTQEIDAWRVVRSPSYQRYAFAYDIPAWHSLVAQGMNDVEPVRRQTDVLIGVLDDAPCVVGICPAMATAYDMVVDQAVRFDDFLDILERGDLGIMGLEDGAPQEPQDWIMELMDVGAIGLIPPTK